MTEQKPHQNLLQPRDGGYTIIESLVAMIVVSVLMIAIAPVMAFSVATRVQARRTELATQAARAYIDALRTGAIKPSSVKGFPSPINGIVTQTNPPAPSANTTLYCFDLDGKNCDPSGGSNISNRAFYVQGAWQNRSNPAPSDPTTTGYRLLVRVYRGDAAFGSLTTRQQSVANSGIGDRKAPLVVMQTEIPPTTQGGSSARQSLCSRLNPNGTINSSACK